jgi:hypothetical protein
MNCANGFAFAKQRGRKHRAKSHCDPVRLDASEFSDCRAQVGDMDRLLIDNRSTRDEATIENPALGHASDHGDGSKMRGGTIQIFIDAKYSNLPRDKASPLFPQSHPAAAECRSANWQSHEGCHW